jgi:hypothetical protein
MIHHICFIWPFRTLFGLILLLGAMFLFYNAVEHVGPAPVATVSPLQPLPAGYRGTEPPGPPPGYPGSFAGATTTDNVPAQKLQSAGPNAAAKKIAIGKAPAAEPIPSPPTAPPDQNGEPSLPSWVGQSPHFELRGGLEVYVATATAGPYLTEGECDLAMVPEIDRVVTDYAEKEFPQGIAGLVTLDRDLVDKSLIKKRCYEAKQTSFGQMQVEHALLVFDRPVRAAIEQQWRAARVGQRLQYAAAGTAAVLLALGGVYSLLRRKPRA